MYALKLDPSDAELRDRPNRDPLHPLDKSFRFEVRDERVKDELGLDAARYGFLDMLNKAKLQW